MRRRPSTRTPHDRTRSDLALLVETEARLERDLATARETAAALEQQARERVDQAAAALVAAITDERTRIAAQIERETAARIAGLDVATARESARMAAVTGERADAIAQRIAEQVVALVLAEESS